MGAAVSMDSKDEKLVDLPSLGDDDVPMLDLKTPAGEVDVDDPLIILSKRDVSKMKKRSCSVDAKLSANPRRKAPPIQPKTCMEGSVAMGKDDEPYVVHKGRWVKASKRLEEKQKELIKERLASRTPARPRGRPRKATSPKRKPGRHSSPPARKGKSKSEGGKGGPRKPGKQASPPARKTQAKTPKRKRCPKGSRKSKKSGKCTKK